MKAKNLIILGASAAVLVAVAVRFSRETPDAAAERVGQPVFPDLPVNDVEQVVITTPEGTATVARAADTWAVPARFGYPADFEKIRGLLLKLSRLKIGQVVTVGDAQKASLKMVAPGGGANAGTSIDLLGAGGKQIASLLIGAEHRRTPQGEGSMYGGYADGGYVSPDGGKTVFLVTESVGEGQGQPKEWLDRDLLNVEPSEISRMTVAGADGTTLRFDRPADGGSLKLEGLGENEELDSGKLSSLESAFSYLKAGDIADPALTDAQLGMTNATVVTAETKNGAVYTAKVGGIAEGTGERYVRLVAALRPVEAPAATSTNAAEAAAEQKKFADERKQTEEKVAAIGKKLKSWTFLVESYKADSMTPTRAGMVKEKKKEEDKQAATNQPAAAAEAPAQAGIEAPPAQ